MTPPLTRVYVISSPSRKFLRLKWVDPLTRRTCYASAQTTKRKEAERAALAKEAELANAYASAQRAASFNPDFLDRLPSDGSLPIDDFQELYESDRRRRGNREKSIAKIGDAFRHLKSISSIKTLADVDRQRLSQFLDGMIASELSPGTIPVLYANVKAALRWAANYPLIPSLPGFPEYRRPTKGGFRGKGRPVTQEEYQRMLHATPLVVGDEAAGYWATALEAFWLSGMRLEELIAVRWDESGEMHIRWNSAGRPQLVIKEGADKSGKPRILPLTPDYAEHLTQIRQGSGQIYHFPGPSGRDITSIDNIGRTISAIGRAANVKVGKTKYATAHDLRRSFGTRWAERVTPAVLKDLMRHDSIETTMQFYVQLEADQVQDSLWRSINNPPTSAASLPSEITCPRCQFKVPVTPNLGATSPKTS